MMFLRGLLVSSIIIIIINSEMCTTSHIASSSCRWRWLFYFLRHKVGPSVDRKVEFFKVTICWNSRNIYPVAAYS